jgi:hypothetical protein
VIAGHSPQQVGKVGLSVGLWRKDGTEGPSVTGSPFSPVRFADELSRNTAVFRLIRREEAGFLCIPDCVAEREGFEPSIELLDPITV